MLVNRAPIASQRARYILIKLGIAAAFMVCLFAAVATSDLPVSASSHGCDNDIAVPGQETLLTADCENAA